MPEVLNDDIEVQSAQQKLPKGEQVVPAKRSTPNSVWGIKSPLVRGSQNNGLRARKGWHQTWKREDEVEEAKETGYMNIQTRGKNTDGSYKDEKPGAETGPIMKRIEAGYKDRWEYAMECREELYQEHIHAMAALSHRRYNSQEDVLQEYIAGKNRDFGTRKEQLRIREENEINDD